MTRILKSMERGDLKAGEELLPLVYEELRRLAAAKMAHERAGQTLQPTALVHEAWLRLGGGGDGQWENRGHFFGAASEAMRRILIDRARRKNAQRRGGGERPVDIQGLEIAVEEAKDDELLAVDEALQKFVAVDAQKAELVKLRYFGGLTIEQTAQALGISEATAKRWWIYSRAWLRVECGKND